MNVSKTLPLSVVRVGGFWGQRIENIANEVIPFQWKALNDQIPGAEPSHAIENFRIASGQSSGKFYGLIFQDSDVGKWIEAAAYTLALQRDPALEKLLDETVALIGSAQQADGYLNTHYTAVEPDKRWSNLRDCHELYCAGHLIEGAVA